MIACYGILLLLVASFVTAVVLCCCDPRIPKMERDVPQKGSEADESEIENHVPADQEDDHREEEDSRQFITDKGMEIVQNTAT